MNKTQDADIFIAKENFYNVRKTLQSYACQVISADRRHRVAQQVIDLCESDAPTDLVKVFRLLGIEAYLDEYGNIGYMRVNRNGKFNASAVQRVLNEIAEYIEDGNEVAVKLSDEFLACCRFQAGNMTVNTGKTIFFDAKQYTVAQMVMVVGKMEPDVSVLGTYFNPDMALVGWADACAKARSRLEKDGFFTENYSSSAGGRVAAFDGNKESIIVKICEVDNITPVLGSPDKATVNEDGSFSKRVVAGTDGLQVIASVMSAHFKNCSKPLNVMGNLTLSGSRGYKKLLGVVKSLGNMGIYSQSEVDAVYTDMGKMSGTYRIIEMPDGERNLEGLLREYYDCGNAFYANTKLTSSGSVAMSHLVGTIKELGEVGIMPYYSLVIDKIQSGIRR